MSTAAAITGYLIFIAFAVALICGAIMGVVGRIIQARELQRDKAITEYIVRVGHRLNGDADWFSEDPATCKLLKEVADNFRRGVSMDPNSTRERWRQWRKAKT